MIKQQLIELLATKVHAAPQFDGVTENYAQHFYAGSTRMSLPQMIGFLINILLSVAGIVILFLIIYAGILWMTAGGRDEQLTKAKSILVNSIIGLVIILTSLAVSTFVQSTLINPEAPAAPSQNSPNPGGGNAGNINIGA